MRKSLITTLGLVLIATLGFGESVVSVIGTSVGNGTEYAQVPVNLTNTEAVGGLQFSLKDIPNQLSVAAVSVAGRTGAEPLDDLNGDNIWTPGETYTDVNENGQWDGPFTVEFNDRDSTVSVLIFDPSGNSIIPGNGPICSIYFQIPTTVSDEIIDLRFHEILDADPQFLLVVTDPEGNAINTTWLNGFLTVGGIEVGITAGGGGSAGTLSVPIAIEMTNAVPVKGIQFNIADGVEDYLTIESVVGVGRGASFSFVGNEVAGQSMVLGVNFDGDEIAPGTGAIMEVTFMVDGNAPDGAIPLAFAQLIVAAAGGVPLPSNGLPGVFQIASGVGDEDQLPEIFDLAQNYPNPFNPTTSIGYSVPEAADVRLGIYNLLGQEIRTLAVGQHQPGNYTTLWDGLDKNGIRVESGVYLYRMSSSTGFGATRKLVLLK